MIDAMLWIGGGLVLVFLIILAVWIAGFVGWMNRGSH